MEAEAKPSDETPLTMTSPVAEEDEQMGMEEDNGFAPEAEEALDEPEDGIFPPAEEDLEDYGIETEETGQAEYVTEAFHTEEEPASDAFLVDLERSPPASLDPAEATDEAYRPSLVDLEAEPNAEPTSEEPEAPGPEAVETSAAVSPDTVLMTPDDVIVGAGVERLEEAEEAATAAGGEAELEANLLACTEATPATGFMEEGEINDEKGVDNLAFLDS